MPSPLWTFAFLAAPLVLLAQDPGVLKNTGQPMRVPFACAEEDLQAAGLLCTEDEPCPIYLELNTIAPAGKKLFIAGDLHSDSGTLSSVLIGSDDGGASWKETAKRIPSAGIAQLQFYDLEHGWAGGETQYPLSRDPFFFVTSDGGATWRERPVSEEGGPGAIQQFWFDSADHGELVIDAGKSSPGGRYVSYETQTSGESWMVRGTSDRLPKLRTSVSNPDFRARAANNKTWEVEKRVGEKWEPMASFLIEVANCRIKAPEAKEPPPPEVETGPAKDYVEEIHLGGSQTAPPKKKKAP